MGFGTGLASRCVVPIQEGLKLHTVCRIGRVEHLMQGDVIQEFPGLLDEFGVQP